jgi:peroxiredoxin family protein
MAELPNVRLEACSVATALFGVDNETILPEIVVVGNTFISALGFQAVGYAPILIQ